MNKTLIAMALVATGMSMGAYAATDGGTGTITFQGQVTAGTCTAPADFANATVPLNDVGQNEFATSSNAQARPWEKSFTFTECPTTVTNVTTGVSMTGQGAGGKYIDNKGTSTNVKLMVFSKSADQGNEGKALESGTSWDTAVSNAQATVNIYGKLMRWGTGAISPGTLSYPINLTATYN
jgi:type 1 fimbria pilin